LRSRVYGHCHQKFIAWLKADATQIEIRTERDSDGMWAYKIYNTNINGKGKWKCIRYRGLYSTSKIAAAAAKVYWTDFAHKHVAKTVAKNSI